MENCPPNSRCPSHQDLYVKTAALSCCGVLSCAFHLKRAMPGPVFPAPQLGSEESHKGVCKWEYASLVRGPGHGWTTRHQAFCQVRHIPEVTCVPHGQHPSFPLGQGRQPLRHWSPSVAGGARNRCCGGCLMPGSHASCDERGGSRGSPGGPQSLKHATCRWPPLRAKHARSGQACGGNRPTVHVYPVQQRRGEQRVRGT